MQSNQSFILASPDFYDIAKSAYYKAKKGFDIHHQPDALVAVVFAAFSLEAFINELGEYARLVKEASYTEQFLDNLIDAITENQETQEHKQTQEKFWQASDVLSQAFVKGEQPYQDFADLFRLRNALVHAKPDLFKIDNNGNLQYLETTKKRKLTRALQSKNKNQEILLVTTVNSLPLKVGTAETAKWACDTASKMIYALIEKIPESTFKEDIDFFYRGCFPLIEEEEKQSRKQEIENRQAQVAQIDALRERLLENYGEFPDSTAWLREDRER